MRERDRFNAGITWLDEPLQERADGPLAGRTLLVKDLIDTAGIRTTYGSRLYADHVPDAATRPSSSASLDAGAAIVGKANLVEFAWGVLGANEWYGTVHNPVRPGRTTGGSSSGNAAAIAAGLCELGARHRHGLLRPPALGRVRARRAEDPARRRCRSTASIRSARRSTRSARWPRPCATSPSSGRCSPAGACPSRVSTVSRSASCARRRTSPTGARPRRATRRRRGSAASSRSARASSRRRSPARRPTRGRSSCTRRRARTPRRSPRAPTSTAP